MFKKTIALLLAVLTLSSLVLMPSCKKDEGEEEGTTVTAASTEEIDYLDTLDAPDFDEGEEFVIYQFGTATIAAGQTFEKAVGEPICDSVYYRNQEIEARYGVKIVYQGACYSNVSIVETTVDKITQQNLSQDDQIDLWEFSVVNAAALMYGGENFLPLNEMEYVNLDEPWWSSDANSHFEINGKIFTGTGDVSLSYYGMPFCLAINKRIAQEEGIDDRYGKSVYDLVRDGEWTYEKMLTMSANAANDKNGDQIMLPEDDVYGFQYDMGCGYAFLVSLGYGFSKVENGLPVVDMKNENITTAAEWIRDNLGADSTHAIGGYTTDTEITQIFSSGRSLFGSAQISHIASKMRSYPFDFGIVPMPKADEEQERYYSYANIYYSAYMGVPSYTKNTEKVGFMLEVMAYKSYKSVRGEYIDECVVGRADSEEDAEMLRIVLDTVYYDLNLVMNFGKTRDYYLKYIHGEIPNYSSTMGAVAINCGEEVQKYIDSFS